MHVWVTFHQLLEEVAPAEGDNDADTVQGGEQNGAKKSKNKAKEKPKLNKAKEKLPTGTQTLVLAQAKPSLLVFATCAHTSVRPRMGAEKELAPELNWNFLAWLA